MNQKKSILFIICILLLLCTGLFVSPLPAQSSEHHITLKSCQKNNSIQIQMVMNNFSKTPLIIQNKTYTRITIAGEPNSLKIGFPSLPCICRSIIIPKNATMNVDIIDSEYIILENIKLVPSKGNLLRNTIPSQIPYTFNTTVYDTNNWYPSSLVSLQDPYIFRDYTGQTICIHPFQYNDYHQTLKVYNSLTFRVYPQTLNQSTKWNYTNKHHVSRSFHNLYQHHFLNYKIGNERNSFLLDEGNMLIICADEFYQNLTAFKNWKNMKGIHTLLINVSATGGSAHDIKQFITSYYQTNGLTFVLLVGDSNFISTLTSDGHASDPRYGYIKGSDSYPELFVGRLPARNQQQLNTMINRTLKYEKQPYTTSEWYQKGLGIASNEGTGDDNEYDWEHIRNIRSDLLNYTFDHVDELYDGSHGGDDKTGNPTPSDVTQCVNHGRSIINYCGHGNAKQWTTTGFHSSDVHGLTNDNLLPFIISVACKNGQFTTYNECFCEAWLRATNEANNNETGALSITGSSKNMAWSPPMAAQDEMNDILTEHYQNISNHTLGGIHSNGCIKMNDEYGQAGYAETDTWHLFGDPSVQLRTRPPQQLTVRHQSLLNTSSPYFNVTVTNTTQAMCALSTNATLIGYNYTNETGNTSIVLPTSLSNLTPLNLVVTSYNAIPYNSTITVADTLPPFITNITVSSPPFLQNESVNISCQIIDDIQVNECKIILFSQHNTSNFTRINTTMNHDENNTYWFQYTFLKTGRYSYYIWANDTSRNSNQSKLIDIEIKQPHQITSLSTNWNLICLPFHKTIHKSDVYITYNNTIFFWQDAVETSLILDYIYAFNTSTQSYQQHTYFHPTRGYWVYSYHPCQLWGCLFNQNHSANHTIDLNTTWNCIGFSDNQSVNKKETHLLFNNTTLSWSEAVDNGLILDTLYIWNQTHQHYEITTLFTSKKGCWLYAYNSCILTKTGS